MELIRLSRGTLTLPPNMIQNIDASAQFTVIVTGDTIILKKVTPPRLSEIAERTLNDQPMSLSEIAKEVHNYRRSRRARRR